MKTLNFLTSLRERDIQVWADGDRLRCNAPLGGLTPKVRRELQERKQEILEFLRSADSLARQQPGIVPLQSNGANIPIFAVAGHNGDVFCFRALAQHLGVEQPFFGLEPPGLDGSREPLTRVEELAAYFAGQIGVAHPLGPYVIIGYCAGGTIAFELAQQLLRGGADVVTLALFGSPFPTSYRLLPRLRQHLWQTATRIARHLCAVPGLSASERRAYLAERWKNLKAERATRKRPDPVLAWRENVGRATLAAIRRYVPQPFGGRLDLFWPSPKWQCACDAVVRWPRLAQTSGKHFGPDGSDGSNMLREPHAAAFADQFKRSLSQIQDGEPGVPRRKAAPQTWPAHSIQALSNQNA